MPSIQTEAFRVRAFVALSVVACLVPMRTKAQTYGFDPSFNMGTGFIKQSAPGSMFDVEMDGQGRIYVAGDFTQYNGNARNGFVRLLSDGTFDPTYNNGSGANGAGLAIGFQSDEKVILGGSFSTFNSQSTGSLVRLNLDGTIDPTFVANVTWQITDMLVLPDDRIVACGRPFNANTNRFVVRFLPNGAIDPSFNVTLTQDPWELEAQPDGKLLIGGAFTSINGAPAPRIARLNVDGTRDNTFDPPPSALTNQVRAIKVLPNGKILVGRPYTAGQGIVRLQANGALDPGFVTTSNMFGLVEDIQLFPDERCLALGFFSDFNGSTTSSYAIFNTTGELAGNTETGLPYAPLSFPVSQFRAGAIDAQGKLILVGEFPTFGGVQRNSIVRLTTCDTYYADTDGDSFGNPNVSLSACTQPLGYVLNNADCDDTNPAVQGPAQWWLDADGDGWGAPFTLLMACTQPVGYVNNDIDCDDTDPLVMPTEWCVDVDNDGHGDPNNTIWACDQPLGTVPVGSACDDCNDNDASVYPGAPCDDGDPNTTDDRIRPITCVCQGVPCTNMVFELQTDANGAETSWELSDADDQSVECTGSGYTSNSGCIQETCCLEAGGHMLKVLDSGSGMSGSYLLRQAGGGRVVHNSDGFTGSMAQQPLNGSFSLPLGTDGLSSLSCDNNGLATAGFLLARSNPLVAAQVVPPGNWSQQPSNTGYEFWIFDPDGGYSQQVFQSLRSLNSQTGADANARYLRLNNTAFATNPVPTAQTLNVRVRGRVAGVNQPWGPACRIRLSGTSDAYWPTHLVDAPGDILHACGATVNYDASTALYKIDAVRRIGSTAYHVRFRFERVSDGTSFFVDRVSGSSTNNRTMWMTKAIFPGAMANWPTDQPDPLPGEEFIVRVATKRIGTTTWSAFGPCCKITIGGVSALAQQPADPAMSLVALDMDTDMELWPNPNKDRQLNLLLRGVEATKEVLHITLLDAQGRLAYDRTSASVEPEAITTIDLTGLAPGLYLVRANVGEQHFMKRLVIE